jgi:hypothetical protein
VEQNQKRKEQAVRRPACARNITGAREVVVRETRDVIGCDRWLTNYFAVHECDAVLPGRILATFRRNVHTSAESKSGGAPFESRPDHRLSRLRFYVVFFSLSRQMPGVVPRLGHDHFLPDSNQFVIIYASSYHLTLYSLVTESVVE